MVKIVNNEENSSLKCLSSVAESNSDAVAITSSNGELIYQNQSFQKLAGKIEGDKLINIHVEKEAYLSVLKTLKTNQNWIGEIKISNKSGEIENVNVKAFPIGKPESKEFYFFWIYFNTVISKRTEQQLELLKHGIDNAQIGIYQIDDLGNIVYANDYACKSLGYTYEEITSIQLFDIDPFIEKEQFLAFRKGVAFKESFTSEGRHRKKDGSTYPVEVTTNMKRLGEKGVTMSFVKDISVQKEAEAQLNKQKQQLDKLMKMEHLGNWEYDFINDEFLFNDNVYSIFKTSTDKIGTNKMSVHQYSELFVYPDDRIIVRNEIKKAIKTKNTEYSSQFEHKILYANGDVGYISVSFYIEKDKNGQTIKAYGVNQDISHRKEIENDLLVAKEKAEESDRLKSAFLANMSHEIRTPMNSILGFADLINKKDISEFKKEKYIDIIKKSGNRMLALINDLIDISKIESGQVEFSYKKVHLDEFTEYIHDFFKPEAEKKNIELKLNTKKQASGIVIVTDMNKLEQILINLIKNALKYTNEGYIDFGYYLKTDPGSNDKETVNFYVEDTGIGVKDDLKMKIFERFNQGEAYRYKEIEGAGLGLAITKAFVELLGGRIWVEPNKAKGSVFNFTLPLNTELMGVKI